MKRIIIIILIIILFPSFSYAGSYSDNDILIERMIQKGLLSPMEAQLIKEETQEYVAKHMAEGRMMTVPEWVQRIKLKGDLRLRYEYEDRKIVSGGRPVDGEQSQNLRLRLGLIAKLNTKLTVALGIATGGSDPRSDNETFGESFSDGDIRLDHAFAEYYPAPWLSLIAGKYPKGKYLWMPTDAFWDDDINPEGASIYLTHNVGRYFDPFVSAGRWQLETNATTNDRYLEYAQAGVGFDEDHFDAKVAGAIYNFKHLKGDLLDNTACSNSGLDLNSLLSGGCSGTLAYDYKTRGLSAEVGYKMMIHEQYKRIAFFGDYMINDGYSDVPENLDEGWAYGMRLGDMTIKDPWQWQLIYQYTHLEKDVFPDIFPNGSRYGGQTGIKGHKFGLELGVMENATLGFTYYRDEKFQPYDFNPGYLADNGNPQSLFQVDFNFRF